MTEAITLPDAVLDRLLANAKRREESRNGIPRAELLRLWNIELDAAMKEASKKQYELQLTADR